MATYEFKYSNMVDTVVVRFKIDLHMHKRCFTCGRFVPKERWVTKEKSEKGIRPLCWECADGDCPDLVY